MHNRRETAVGFVVFNRPDHTVRSFAPIRQAQPTQLFIISDGPRPHCPDDAEKIAQSRAIAESVDWDCDVMRIYSDDNLGCAQRLSSGFTEVFRHTERAIFLEDDCVADPSFFSFCDQLLERYADNEKVMSISGDNFEFGQTTRLESYFFSNYMLCWGWASWRRAWEKFDLSLSAWPDLVQSGHLRRIGISAEELHYWKKVVGRIHRQEISTWAIPWLISCWQHAGLTILPSVNLVSNIGFDERATHTKHRSRTADLPTSTMGSLCHPDKAEADLAADHQLFHDVYRPKRRRLLGSRKLRAWWDYQLLQAQIAKAA